MGKLLVWVGLWGIALTQGAMALPLPELAMPAKDGIGYSSLVLVQYQRHGGYRSGGGSRQFNSNNFHNNVIGNRNTRVTLAPTGPATLFAQRLAHDRQQLCLPVADGLMADFDPAQRHNLAQIPQG